MCFRVELDGGEVKVPVFESFQGIIIHIRVGNPAPLRQGICIHRKPMVLGCHKDPPVFETDRLVGATVPEFQLIRLAPECQCTDLDTHADTEDGKLAQEVPYALYCIRCLAGITRSVADEECIGPAGKNFIGTGIIGKDMEIPVTLGKADNHILFYAQIKDRDSFPAARYMIRLPAGHLRNRDNI